MYKEILVEDGESRRDQILAQGAFYSGARCVFKVLDYLVEDGDVDELQRVIRRHGRTIRVLQASSRGSGGTEIVAVLSQWRKGRQTPTGPESESPDGLQASRP
jgi:hypothetical protein